MKFWNLDKIRISVLFNIVLVINIFILVYAYISNVNTSIYYKSKVAELEQELLDVRDEYETMLSNKDKDMQLLLNNYNELRESAKQINDINKELLKDNDELEELNLTLMEENEDLADRVSVYEEYKIFMFREQYSSPRTDCSYDLLKYLEKLVEDKDVKNIPFYCSWIMIESTWNNHDLNHRSHANGLPQFLPGTGKWIYEEEMGNYSGNLYKVIDSYRGLHDEPYLKRFNYYLSFFDLSIDKVAEEVYSNFWNSHIGGGQG